MKNQISQVKFYDHQLIVITQGEQKLVAMKSICEGIGLAWGAQYNRIQRDEVLSSCVFVMNIQLPSDTQSREVVFLPLEYLNGWLFGIDVSRCREEIRPTLIQYKRECYQALYEHWHSKEVSSTPTLSNRRWLITFDHEGKEHVTPVQDGAFVMTPAQLLSWLADPERIAVDADMLFQFVAAASERLKRMHDYQAVQLKRAREAGLQVKLV